MFIQTEIDEENEKEFIIIKLPSEINSLTSKECLIKEKSDKEHCGETVNLLSSNERNCFRSSKKIHT
jgi:hypothetical protein